MLNKNVADYTNFDGKTNKKIVHAPGGDTHFSLAWSNEKTDYGPERNIRKKDNYQQYNQQQGYYNQPSYQKPNNFNYNEPIRVMDDRAYQQQSYPQKQQMYSVHSVQSVSQNQQGGKKYGGEYGYNNYSQEDNYKQQKPQYYQQDSLDQKLQEEQKTRNSNANNIPRPQNSNIKPSIKIHEQKTNMVLGDNSYNYWRDNSDQRKSTNQSNKRPPLYEQPVSQFPQPNYQQKTSVKVHNPPGGKSSISFG